MCAVMRVIVRVWTVCEVVAWWSVLGSCELGCGRACWGPRAQYQ